MRGYLQATIKECRKALASHNTGLHARARVDEARRFMRETACRKVGRVRWPRTAVSEPQWPTPLAPGPPHSRSASGVRPPHSSSPVGWSSGVVATQWGRPRPHWGRRATPVGAAKHPTGVSNRPTGESKTPRWGVKPPTGEIKLPSGEIKLPSGEIKLPSGEIKLPSGEFSLPSGAIEPAHWGEATAHWGWSAPPQWARMAPLGGFSADWGAPSSVRLPSAER